MRLSAASQAIETLEKVVAERDALRDALRRHQDARVFDNLHTRQVARAIEREADTALSWRKPKT